MAKPCLYSSPEPIRSALLLSENGTAVIPKMGNPHQQFERWEWDQKELDSRCFCFVEMRQRTMLV